MIRRVTVRTAVCIGLAITCFVLAVSTASAQVRPIRVLGGSTRFTAPMNDIGALSTTMGRATIQEDLATVLEVAGLPGVTEQVQQMLAVGQVRVATLPPGTVIEWMALRRDGPEVVRNISWAGDAPLEGFEFTVDDLTATYTFFVPAICGNLSLIGRGPSLEAAAAVERARIEEERVAAEQARLVAAAAAEQARLQAERVAAEQARLVAAAAEQARLQAERVAAEQARLVAAAAEQARLQAEREAAEQALADYRAAQERDLRVRPFVASLFGFGKQQRQYDATDPARRGRVPIPATGSGLPLRDGPAFFDSLSRVGVALKMSDHWTFASAIGVAVNVDELDRTTLFGDIEFDFMFARGAYLGTGLTFWDVTHSEAVTPGWLGTMGVPVWTSDERLDQVLIVIEYRQLFDRGSDPDVNYQFWGGLKYLYR